MNPGKQQKFEYAPEVLRLLMVREEKDLSTWKDIVNNPNSDALSLRQAKGNLSGTESRINELKAAINLLNPPREESITNMK